MLKTYHIVFFSQRHCYLKKHCLETIVDFLQIFPMILLQYVLSGCSRRVDPET